MFKKFTIFATAAAIGLGGFSLMASPANAGAVEYFKCSLADGKTMDDLVSVAAHFHQVIADAGIDGYVVSYLSPLFAQDIKRGNFHWVGTADDVATIGEINDFWESDANKAVRDHWIEVTSDCETSSVHFSTYVE